MKLLIVAALVTIGYAAPNFGVDLGSKPMENPDLFGGDMLGVEMTDRNVIPQLSKRWTENIVPYAIDFSVERYGALIQQAMENYHQMSCVRFKERTDEKNYIRIFAGTGCYSQVGMIGGAQPLSLGQGCMFYGTIVHELGHALGFWHEQNRSDRDDYLIIYWENIMNGMNTQFFLLQPHENLLIDPFDYDSIMLYGERAFSKDGRSKTMKAKQEGVRLVEPIDKNGLSRSDIIRIRHMYPCTK